MSKRPHGGGELGIPGKGMVEGTAAAAALREKGRRQLAAAEKSEIRSDRESGGLES